MSNVFFIADTHFGHKGIIKYRPFATEGAHTAHIMDKWREVVDDDDLVYVLGDACFTQEGLLCMASLPGRKILVRGNHDNSFTTDELLSVFTDVEGFKRKYKFWLSHAPIHESESRGCINIHGHTHEDAPKTGWHICVSAEVINYTPIDLLTLRRKAHELQPSYYPSL